MVLFLLQRYICNIIWVICVSVYANNAWCGCAFVFVIDVGDVGVSGVMGDL